MAEAEFEKAGITGVEKFVATDGKTLPESRIKPGEMGITHSVMRIFYDAIVKNYSSILILEDDVEFAEDLTEALSWAPEDWEILHFGGNHAAGKPKRVNDRISVANKTLASHAIAFRRCVFERLLGLLNHTEEVVDITYSRNLHRFKSYVFVPSIAWQKPSYSDLAEAFADYPFLR
jgi:GR25 family glycosyltransferase involved in LPS biosynthesis